MIFFNHFLKFFSAARPGDVCYSHAHCHLWDSDTHCDFIIPDLFGRCQCTAPMRRDGDVCRPDSLVRPHQVSIQASNDVPENEEDQFVVVDQGDAGYEPGVADEETGKRKEPVPIFFFSLFCFARGFFSKILFLRSSYSTNSNILLLSLSLNDIKLNWEES